MTVQQASNFVEFNGFFLLRIVFYMLIVLWNYRAVHTPYCCTLDTYVIFQVFVGVDLCRLCHQENQEYARDYFSLITEML